MWYGVLACCPIGPMHRLLQDPLFMPWQCQTELVTSVRNGKMGVSVPRQEGNSIYFLPISVYPGKICQEIILILRRQEGGCITHLEMFLFTYSSKC